MGPPSSTRRSRRKVEPNTPTEARREDVLVIDHVSDRWTRPIAETFPTAALVAAVALDGGNFTDLVRLQVDVHGRRVLLVGRSSRRPEADEFVHRAGTVMTALRDTPVPIPTVHWMGTLSDGRAGTLLGYIAGDAVGASADHARVVAAAWRPCTPFR